MRFSEVQCEGKGGMTPDAVGVGVAMAYALGIGATGRSSSRAGGNGASMG